MADGGGGEGREGGEGVLGAAQLQQWREEGYLILRGLFSEDEIGLLRRGFDDVSTLSGAGQLIVQEDLYEEGGSEVFVDIRAGEGGRGRFIRKVEWVGLLHPSFERIRTDARWYGVLDALVGGEGGFKSYKNQINFKHPGSGVDFPWHQDHRPVPAFCRQQEAYVQTILAVDAHTEENGCLWVVPKSHLVGKIHAERYDGTVERSVDVTTAVPCVASPGDVILFNSFLVHGSKPNTTDHPRRAYINGYVRGDRCTVAKWAFAPPPPTTPLTPIPVPATSETDFSHSRRKLQMSFPDSSWMSPEECTLVDTALAEDTEADPA